MNQKYGKIKPSNILKRKDYILILSNIYKIWFYISLFWCYSFYFKFEYISCCIRAGSEQYFPFLNWYKIGYVWNTYLGRIRAYQYWIRIRYRYVGQKKVSESILHWHTSYWFIIINCYKLRMIDLGNLG